LSAERRGVLGTRSWCRTGRGARDDLLFQGGTPKADAGIDAWRDLLAFLDDATKAHGS